jgi:hypothetical protein
MKKIYFSVVMTFMCLASSHVFALIYLQNNFLKPIQYVEQPAAVAHHYQEKIIGNGARVPLYNSAEGMLNPSKKLSIRSVGGRYYDITYLCDQIRYEQNSHKNANAIININPSWGLYGWNITVDWETTKPTSMTESTIG